MNDLSQTNIMPPPLGIFEGVPMAEYHGWKAASNSRLQRIRKSPAHLRAYLEGGDPDTEAKVIGRAIHSAILEPDDFTKRYVMKPEGLDRRTKEGKAKWADLVLAHGPEAILEAEQYATCVGIRDSVHRHEKARGLLYSPERRVELSLVWDHEVADPRFPENGSALRCKARPDVFSPALAGGAIVDVKSCVDASEDAFARSVHKYGYHMQAAHYTDGAHANGLPAEHWTFIAVEKEPPYAVAVYRLMEAAIDAAGEQLAPLLRRYKECVDSGFWPAYQNDGRDDIQDLTLPDYAWGQIDAEVSAQNSHSHTENE